MNVDVQTDTATISSALREAAAQLTSAGSQTARLDAELLLAEALGGDRSRIYMNATGALDDAAVARLRALVARRANGEPVSYIIGRREFWSLDFLVTPAVLTPRPETELLTETAVRLCEAESQISNRKLKTLDLGTGSGVIAVALAKEIPSAEIVATDISADTLEIARANARRHGVEGRIKFVVGDLFAPVAEMRFDAIVSNPPYIRSNEIAALPRDVRDFEPRLALDGGADGLDFYRRIAREAPRRLTAGGFVAVEIGAGMGEEVGGLFAKAGFGDVRIENDLAGLQRVVSARADR